jgi:magnesium transporter
MNAARDIHISQLDSELLERGLPEALKLLENEPDDVVAAVLADLNPAVASAVLWKLPAERRSRILAATPVEQSEQWLRNQAYAEGTIGRLMEHPIAIFRPDVTAREAVEQLRTLVKKAFVTYGFVTDAAGKLLGVLVFRELLFAEDAQQLGDIMLKDPFSLRPATRVPDAMHEVLTRHYPVYPVCDDEGKLLGIVRGQTLFEHQAFEISAQPGRMVGVEKEERLLTPWWRSLLLRHPWLQLNLVTAFAAAAVVGFFQAVIDQIVALAVFLPVLAGQSGNTGCQALAVTLRGMTLGELRSGQARVLMLKEAWLGFLNGAAVGVTAGLGMFAFATHGDHPQPWLLGTVVFFAMTMSCVVSGISGAVVPLTLRRLGADPATASSIFLTTATDVASMGLFLGLASALLL